MSDWPVYCVTIKRSELDALTLEDFAGLDDEDRRILRRSGDPLLRRLADGDLEACKELLARTVEVLEGQ